MCAKRYAPGSAPYIYIYIYIYMRFRCRVCAKGLRQQMLPMVLPRCRWPPFSLQFLIKSNKEIAPGTSGSSGLPFPYSFLLKTIENCSRAQFSSKNRGVCAKVCAVYIYIYIYICCFHTWGAGGMRQGLRRENICDFYKIATS